MSTSATPAPADHAVLQKAAVKTEAAAPKTPNALVTFFLNVFLPILPGLLLAAAPKIVANPKFISVIKQTDVVLDQLLAQAGETD